MPSNLLHATCRDEPSLNRSCAFAVSPRVLTSGAATLTPFELRLLLVIAWANIGLFVEHLGQKARGVGAERHRRAIFRRD